VAQERRADCARDMRATLGPVSAAPEGRASSRQRDRLDAELGEDAVPRLEQALGDPNAELSGEMVVAAPREAQLARGRGDRTVIQFG
jgi:hypothetical protein